MIVKDIMTDPAVLIEENASVYDVANVMRQHNIGAVPVINATSNLVGMVTDRDIVVRNMARGLDPKSHSVSEIMTKDVSFVAPGVEIDEASRMMAREKVRRLPVVENDRVIGLIALGDISACQEYLFETGEALSEISKGCHKKHPSRTLD